MEPPPFPPQAAVQCTAVHILTPSSFRYAHCHHSGLKAKLVCVCIYIFIYIMCVCVCSDARFIICSCPKHYLYCVQMWGRKVCSVLSTLSGESITEWRERGQAFPHGDCLDFAEKPLPPLLTLQHTCPLHEQLLPGIHILDPYMFTWSNHCVNQNIKNIETKEAHKGASLILL